MKSALIIASAALLLTACGDQPQDLGGANKLDAPSYTGTGKAYTEPGWKSGDKASWESKLKARGQYGQNEYNRVN